MTSLPIHTRGSLSRKQSFAKSEPRILFVTVVLRHSFVVFLIFRVGSSRSRLCPRILFAQLVARRRIGSLPPPLPFLSFSVRSDRSALVGESVTSLGLFFASPPLRRCGRKSETVCSRRGLVHLCRSISPGQGVVIRAARGSSLFERSEEAEEPVWASRKQEGNGKVVLSVSANLFRFPSWYFSRQTELRFSRGQPVIPVVSSRSRAHGILMGKGNTELLLSQRRLRSKCHFRQVDYVLRKSLTSGTQCIL